MRKVLFLLMGKNYGPSNSSLFERQQSIIGLSLYNRQWDEVLEQSHQVNNQHQPYMMQTPESWGCIYLSKPWTEFFNLV